MKKGRKFVTHKAVNGDPYFTLVAANGEIMLTSETYSSEQAMMDTLLTLVGKTLPCKIEKK